VLGDFNNGRADHHSTSFIAAGAAKWGQQTRLTLLLPHGYEGAGPEHSSAAPRALPAAQRRKANIRIANCSDGGHSGNFAPAARGRRPAKQAYPLVVMTPKSLAAQFAPSYGKIDQARERRVPRSARRSALRRRR